MSVNRKLPSQTDKATKRHLAAFSTVREVPRTRLGALSRSTAEMQMVRTSSSPDAQWVNRLCRKWALGGWLALRVSSRNVLLKPTEELESVVVVGRKPLPTR